MYLNLLMSAANKNPSFSPSGLSHLSLKINLLEKFPFCGPNFICLVPQNFDLTCQKSRVSSFMLKELLYLNILRCSSLMVCPHIVFDRDKLQYI